MRLGLVLSLAVIAPLVSPPLASAKDAPRRVYVESRPAYFEETPTRRRIVIEKRADRRLTVVDSDGVVLQRSFVDPEPPRRIETRSYVRDGRRKPFALYGGFYGFDRWGYSRDGW